MISAHGGTQPILPCFALAKLLLKCMLSGFSKATSCTECMTDRRLSVQTPSILSWKTQADCANVYNTPNIFAIWALEHITADLIAKGGLEVAGKRARRRAQAVSSPSVTCLACVIMMSMYCHTIHNCRSC